MLRKQELRLSIEFVCFKRESRDKLLWTRYWTCGLRKRRGISGLVERMLCSEERVSHTESTVNITHSWHPSRTLLDITVLTGSGKSYPPLPAILSLVKLSRIFLYNRQEFFSAINSAFTQTNSISWRHRQYILPKRRNI